MRLLEFQPLTSVSFHGSPVGGFEVFGAARAVPTPLPTTVAGALGSLLGVRLGAGDPVASLVELYESLRSRLGCGEESCVKGPLTFFTVGGERVGPFVFAGRFYLLSSVKVGGGFACVDGGEGVVEWELLRRVGVALERRGGEGFKRVAPGFFYRYFVSTFKYGYGPGFKGLGVCGEVVRPVYAYAVPFDGDVDAVVRFGGEGSVARVVASGLELVDRVVRGLVSPLEHLEEGYYVALSPIPLLPLKPGLAKPWEGLEAPFNMEFTEVVGVPRECSGGGGGAAQPPRLRLVRLGLGFSEAAGRRRAQVVSFPPGTLVRVLRGHKPSLSPLLKTLVGLGFATLYKI